MDFSQGCTFSLRNENSCKLYAVFTMHIYTGLQKIKNSAQSEICSIHPCNSFAPEERDTPVRGEWFCISTQRASNYFDWVNVFKADEDTFAFQENLQYFYWNEKKRLGVLEHYLFIEISN